MQANVGTIDRIVRILLALAVAGLYFGGIISGTVAIVLLVVGGILLVTGTVKFCPLYRILGASTAKSDKA
ncbi:MAG: DUF2892 domain-containing protein [Bacteroidota bacterium]